jgi:CHAT domain-containing protein
LYAGAKNLIVSLWKVADSSASALMLEFYNNLLNDQEQKKNKSLRDAKLLILKNTTFAKPYYWSPFILIGK